MDISELGGKWLKVGEKMNKKANVIMFDSSLRLLACNFMSVELTKGYYFEGQQIMIFLYGRLVYFTIDISSSGDNLTLTDSEGMKTEYRKYSNFVPHSIYFFDSNDSVVSLLLPSFIFIIMTIIVIATFHLFFDV